MKMSWIDLQRIGFMWRREEKRQKWDFRVLNRFGGLVVLFWILEMKFKGEEKFTKPILF